MIEAAIFGLGRIGHSFGAAASGEPLAHAAAYARIPGVRVVLGVDPDPGARAAFARDFPEARALAAPPEHGRVDVVSVCSPTTLHVDGVKAALRLSPKVVLCEKPLAPTVEEARRLEALCEGAGATLIVNHSRRYTPMLSALREAAAAVEVCGGCLRYSGGLRHNGVHWIDLLRATIGEVVAALPLDRGEGDDPGESVLLTLRHGDRDVPVHLVSVRGAGASVGEGELWGATGRVRFSEGGRLVWREGIEPSGWAGFFRFGTATPLCEDGLRGHVAGAVEEAVRRCREPGPPTSGAADAIAALSIIERVREGR